MHNMKGNHSQLDVTDKQAPAFCGGNWKEETSNMMQGTGKSKSKIHDVVQKAKSSTKKSK